MSFLIECKDTILGHIGPIKFVRQLPTGELVTSSWDNSIKIWDLVSNRCKNTISFGQKNITSIGISKDGNLIIGFMNGIVKKFNNEQNLKTWYHGHTDSVNAIECLDSKTVITGSDDIKIKIWRQDGTRNWTETLEGHDEGVMCLKILCSGLLVSGSKDKTIKIWSKELNACLLTLKGHEETVRCLQESSNKEIISGSDDKLIKIWNPETGACINTLDGHKDSVYDLLCFGLNFLISASWDKTLKIWNLNTYTCLKTILNSSSILCMYKLNSNEFVTGSKDNKLKIWKIVI